MKRSIVIMTIYYNGDTPPAVYPESDDIDINQQVSYVVESALNKITPGAEVFDVCFDEVKPIFNKSYRLRKLLYRTIRKKG